MLDREESEDEIAARAIMEKQRLSIALFYALGARLAEMGLSEGQRRFLFDFVPRTIAAHDWLQRFRKGEALPPVDAIVAEIKTMPGTELLFALREEPEDEPDPYAGMSPAKRMEEARKRAA